MRCINLSLTQSAIKRLGAVKQKSPVVVFRELVSGLIQVLNCCADNSCSSDLTHCPQMASVNATAPYIIIEITNTIEIGVNNVKSGRIYVTFSSTVRNKTSLRNSINFIYSYPQNYSCFFLTNTRVI